MRVMDKRPSSLNIFSFPRNKLLFCNKCYLNSSFPGLHIDSNGLCDYCSGRKPELWDELYGVTDERKTKLRAELEHTIQNVKGTCAYDCVLALSGGKDSSFLLYYLVKEKKLKVLAVHLKTIFEPRILEKNIGDLRKKIDFDLLTISASEDFFIKFYSGLLRHYTKTGFRDNVCPSCSRLFLGYSIKIAVEKKIPFVFHGSAPGQHTFFELSKEAITDIMTRKGWYFPDSLQIDAHGKEFKDYFWDPLEYSDKTIYPRVIFPFHVMEYNIEELFKSLSENNILQRKRISPLKTSCDLIKVMAYLDYGITGYFKPQLWRSYLVRKGISRKRDIESGLSSRLIRKLLKVIHTLHIFILIRMVENKLKLNFRNIYSEFV